ncbi:MAG: PAAR domain-containing protein [Paludibacteraceae bacterium]|nr:PAAR domain-containing protein [Paludibacteraceae bacterium]MBR6104882.1 PAAR domain-containing protein [Paludibacteraceae bacterium]
MAAAARVGDMTNHGGVVIGPGVPTVLIGGMPAAVMGDMHSCPIPPPTHIPSSPFIKGSSTVLIGGKPALRTNDPCGCGAMPVVGCPTVMIGD